MLRKIKGHNQFLNLIGLGVFGLTTIYSWVRRYLCENWSGKMCEHARYR